MASENIELLGEPLGISHIRSLRSVMVVTAQTTMMGQCAS